GRAIGPRRHRDPRHAGLARLLPQARARRPGSGGSRPPRRGDGPRGPCASPGTPRSLSGRSTPTTPPPPADTGYPSPSSSPTPRPSTI
ncbi:MAG: putative quinone binding protein, partial [uncultured Rubrobacteraceae bacterium]